MENFERNVFINCPYDESYFPLLKTLIFAIKKIGFSPRLALERFDSSEVRLEKIVELILSSKFSIHDLSRIKASKKGEYFRLNMPLELGLDLGCKNFHSDLKYRGKRFLILEMEKYGLHKAMSDMSFADCKCHKGSERELVYEIREWFIELGFKNIPPGSRIWDDYNDFLTNIFAEMKEQGYKPDDIDRLVIPEFMHRIEKI